jgi:3-hydroxyisobutyrate dehydrogenase
MRVGFIGLGNVGGKLAASLVQSGFELTVLDLDEARMRSLTVVGAEAGVSPRDVAKKSDVVITCLPSPPISAAVMEAEDGVLAGLGRGDVWVEMSTTDHREVMRLGSMVADLGAAAADCPVSGGCHRAASGNISIFAGCDRPVFELVLPALTAMGRQVLHTGPLGSASILKVVTNYLAFANLVSLTEALTTAAAAGMDLATTYDAIRISSGNSFVHETESQLILNGSRNISFTLELALKDLDLFQDIAESARVPLELSPLLLQIFADARSRFGRDEWSPNVIRRLEEATGLDIRAAGFPAELVDAEPAAPGREVVVTRSG